MGNTKDKWAALTDDTQDQGYLKAGFLGFPKSGKSYTAALLACAVRKHFKLPGPIAMFDTESGSQYLKNTIKELAGEPLLAKRARAFDTLLRWGQDCAKLGVSVAIVDSITHPWRELCETYLKQKNEARERANRPRQGRLEFQDWNVLKGRWGQWTDFFLNSPLHIIIAGRAGFEWEFVETDEGKKELQKTGVKMKTEGEFGFEPSLLVELERIQQRDTKKRITRVATVLGDRFAAIDGATTRFVDLREGTEPPPHDKHMEAVWTFFKPHVELLTAGAHAKVDTKTASGFEFDSDSEEASRSYRRSRDILLEEIKNELLKAYPSQTAKDKVAKVAALERAFDTNSWTKVECKRPEQLQAGLQLLRTTISLAKKEEAKT